MDAGYSTTNLRYFRTFYLTYCRREPQIRHITSGESRPESRVAVFGRSHRCARALSSWNSESDPIPAARVGPTIGH